MAADFLHAVNSRRGNLESAVQAELDGMPGVQLKFPGMAALALSNAAAIDRDDSPQLRASLTSTVTRLLKELHVESKDIVTALPTVQQQFMMKLVAEL